jgi:hypothetical protein
MEHLGILVGNDGECCTLFCLSTVGARHSVAPCSVGVMLHVTLLEEEQGRASR